MNRLMPIAIFFGLVGMLPSQTAIAHPGHGGLLLQHLAQTSLSPTIVVSGIGIAFMAGAGHALAPGHGKTMVAAYLVGSQGTPQQAIWLGAITTFTHTIGVFILGIVVLCLSRYVLPEQLYPLLSLFSGLTVCGGGFWLLDRQLDPASESSFSSHSHHHEHVHGDYHHQAAPRSLLALGVAGGLVPCPSALVLLLSAIALHHTAYGLLLVSAFSLGLAVILVAIGLSVIYAQKWFKLVPALQPWRHYIPVVGAISVIIAGSFITACAVI